MKKRELLERLEALERRVKILEAELRAVRFTVREAFPRDDAVRTIATEQGEFHTEAE